MRKLMDVTGHGEGDAPEQGGGGGSLPVCLCLLAAVNLAVMMIVTQLPVTPSGLEQVAQHGLQPAAVFRVPGAGAGAAYTFRSCAGGDSVNCHSNDNIAGL